MFELQIKRKKPDKISGFYGPFKITLMKDLKTKYWEGLLSPKKYGKWLCRLEIKYFRATDENIEEYLEEGILKKGRDIISRIMENGI